VIDCDAFDVLHGSSQQAPLAPAAQADFDAHLEACPACLARLQSYVTLREVLRRLAPYDQPSLEQVPLPERLVSRLMAARAAALEGGQHKQGLGS